MQEQPSVPPDPPLPLYLAIRVIGLVLLLPEPVLIGPMHAYLKLEKLGPAKGLLEYPWPMAVLLELPLRAGATSRPAYVAGWLLASGADRRRCVCVTAVACRREPHHAWLVALVPGAAACTLTQLVYPLNYGTLVNEGQTSAWVLAALTLRDLLLVALGVRLTVQAWRATAPHQALRFK